MGRVSVSRYDIEQIKKNHLTFLGAGREGGCHYIGDGKVLKIFFTPKTRKEISFVGYKSDMIAFPIDIYYYEDSKMVAGYTMNYLLGTDIYKGLPNYILISDLINAYDKIRQEVKKFSNIYMCDLASVNILYDYSEHRINIIDTNCWYRKKDSYKRNISHINGELITSILHKINIEEIDKYPTLFKLYQEYRNILKGFRYLDKVYDENLFLKFLEELVKISKNISGEVKNVADLGEKILKKLWKIFENVT